MILPLRSLTVRILRPLALCAALAGGCSPQLPALGPQPRSNPTEVILANGARDAGLGCGAACQKQTRPNRAAPAPAPAPEPEVRPTPEPEPHPLHGKETSEIARLVADDLESLGSMSFGRAARGGLINAVHLPEHDRWVLVDPRHAWGTQETVDYLVHAVQSVFERFPGSHPLFVGDLSRKTGGKLRPHLSHQSGRDVDISYYYSKNPKWYARAHAGNLDLPRSWALVRTLIAETDVHFIFMDRRVQKIMYRYAEAIGEDPGWLSSVFHGAGRDEPPIIRHQPGHATHLHVRFYNPIAEETARRCYASLLRQKKLLPARYNVTHRVKRGDTLIGLAKRYRVRVRDIQRANALQGSIIKAGRKYFIPRSGPARPRRARALPPRRVPPEPTPTAGPIAAR